MCENDYNILNLVNELIVQILELREDMALSVFAQIRDIKNAKRIKHEDIWQ